MIGHSVFRILMSVATAAHRDFCPSIHLTPPCPGQVNKMLTVCPTLIPERLTLLFRCCLVSNEREGYHDVEMKSFAPWEGHGAMVRAWLSADVAAWSAVSNPAWCSRIFREISCFSPLHLGTLLRWFVLGQDTSPSNASLDSSKNECLVDGNVYDKFNAPKRLQDCMLPGELKWHMNEQVQWPGGKM